MALLWHCTPCNSVSCERYSDAVEHQIGYSHPTNMQHAQIIPTSPQHVRREEAAGIWSTQNVWGWPINTNSKYAPLARCGYCVYPKLLHCFDAYAMTVMFWTGSLSPFDRCVPSLVRTMFCKSIGLKSRLCSTREGSDHGLAGNANSQASQNKAHHVETVVEMGGRAVSSCCPHWHDATICSPFLGTQHGFRLQLATLSCALLVVGFVGILTRIPWTTIVPR